MDVVGKVYISWKNVEQLIQKIAEQINKDEIKFISGLSRGGLIPAVMLSHLTGISYS